ncbi:hypothetical protein [Hyphobacterium marinum]|uniref:Uncharacterized protein n=1 Tax=Hyphobacterium marinum TaxID=3116574 RepID=A0ABU7LUT1_9PROT|nr:hypothetical protein [Hyphobacterium sp. Y6023]MEE2565317.1 hypothetical protein [Hyphobacterium sp. Y6023]
MKPYFAALLLSGLLAAPALAQDDSRLAGGPGGDRAEYSGSPVGPVTGSVPGPQVIEIWDGQQWRSYDYCRARGGCVSDTPPPDYVPRQQVSHRTDVRIPDHAPRRFADCPDGTRRETPAGGGDPICIVVHSGSGYRAAEYREPAPRPVARPIYHVEAPRYEERPRHVAPPRYVEPPRQVSPCSYREPRPDYRDCGGYRDVEYADTYRYTEHRSYNREWYGQDGRYWRVVDVYSHGADACPCARRGYGYSACDHRHESDYRYREEAYGYYQDGYYSDDLAWSYAGVRSPVYYGGGGGGGARVFGSLNFPSAGARARSFAGAGAGAGAGASATVNTSTRVNVNVGVRGGYGGRGGHGGHGGGGGNSGGY